MQLPLWTRSTTTPPPSPSLNKLKRPSRILRLLAAVSLISCTSLYLYRHRSTYISTHPTSETHVSLLHPSRPLIPLLSPNEQIFVISLPQRKDRRVDMEVLRRFMGLSWRYVDATEKASDVVRRVLEGISRLRMFVVEKSGQDKLQRVNFKLPFRWPVHLIPAKPKPKKSFTKQTEELLDTLDTFDIYQEHEEEENGNSLPLVVSKGDFILTPYTPTLRRHMFISPARVACWDSHLRVIQSILGSSSNTSTAWDITIILEDDIDMELDIRRRLRPLWERLPDDWDIVFLGHCWSDEGVYDALSVSGAGSSFNTNSTHKRAAQDVQNRLHPSRAPQCTHAYALSPLGARRLYEHLTYPPFAYSRAIDQAYAWLVKSGRLRAYSVVPGVVVQRVEEAGWLEWIWSWFSGKEMGKTSDIWGTSGGATRWRDELVSGVFSGKDGVVRS